ncbi:MAG: DUF4388 domain-containing protein, partial [Bradymonadaceae bacterium]
MSTSDPTDENPAPEPSYRFRDGSGLIFGPMGQKTLYDFLRTRRPRPEDRVSFHHGPWKKVDEIDGIDIKAILRDRADKAARHVPVEVATHAQPDPGVEPSLASQDTDVIRDLKRALHNAEAMSPSHEDSTMEQIIDVGAFVSDTAISLDGLQDSSSSANSAPSIPLPPDDSQDLSGKTFQEFREQYASYEGSLREVFIARILARLDRSKSTGRLHVKHDHGEKSIYVREGEPIFVDSDLKDELLGNFLITRALITEEQLQEALARLNEWGGRLGDALVAIGAIPAHEIFKHLSDQMREKILEVFTWEDGYYGYYENQEPSIQGYPLGLETYETIVEGCRDRISLERIKEIYTNRAHVAMYTREPAPIHIDRM